MLGLVSAVRCFGFGARVVLGVLVRWVCYGFSWFWIGGLFALIVLAVAWLCWLVFEMAGFSGLWGFGFRL